MTESYWPRPLSGDRAASALCLVVVDDRVRASRDRLADSACYSRSLNPLGRVWVRFAKEPAHVAGCVRAHTSPSDSRLPAPRSRLRTPTASSCRPIGAICSSEVARRRHGRKWSRLGRSRQPRSGTDRRPEQRDRYFGVTLEFEPGTSWWIRWVSSARLLGFGGVAQ